MLQKIQKYLRQIHNLFITNKLLLQLEALSNCDNFTVITILYDNDVLIWDCKDNNVTKVSNNNVKINQTVPGKMSKYVCSKLVYHVRLMKIPSIVILMPYFLLKVSQNCQN